MKLNHTAVVMGIALALFLGPRSATAWTSGPEETPGPQEVRNVWSWEKKKNAPANEHAELLKRAFMHAGLPAPLFPSPFQAFEARVFTQGGTTNGGLPSFIPAPLSNAKAIAIRRYTLPGFAALPDHSYALWDWASGNETCPADTFVEGTDLSGKDPAVTCHTFSSHLGILNSTHFPPQSENTYRWYHELALKRAKECKTLNDNVSAAIFDVDGDQVGLMAAMVTECEREALVIEAVGQHFLQDAWAMGHMWERWGTPFLSGFKNIYGNSPIAEIAEERRARALAVALISGAIHGADSYLTKILPLFKGGDQMSYGRSRDVTWRQLPGDPLQGIGDIYADLLFSDSDYVFQSDRLLDCSTSGVLDVYRKTAMVLGEPTGRATVNPVGPECFSQRATNLAIWEGLGLLKDPRAASAINLVIYSETSISSEARVTLSVETKIELAKLASYVAYRTFFLEGWPNRVDLANSGLVRPYDTFMQTGINSVLTKNQDDPPAPYADPRREANPSHLQDPDTHARYIARVFHKAHVADWCIDNEADPEELRKRVESATPAERPAAYAACVEFTERHVRLGSMPSICEAATASSLPYSFGDTTGATNVKTAAMEFCGCDKAAKNMTAVNDSASTNLNTPVKIDVKANDTAPDGLPLNQLVFSALRLVDPSKGNVAENPDGTITFTPADNVTGDVVIEYALKSPCGAISNTAKATVTIASGDWRLEFTDTAAATAPRCNLGAGGPTFWFAYTHETCIKTVRPSVRCVGSGCASNRLFIATKEYSYSETQSTYFSGNQPCPPPKSISEQVWNAYPGGTETYPGPNWLAVSSNFGSIGPYGTTTFTDQAFGYVRNVSEIKLVGGANAPSLCLSTGATKNISVSVFDSVTKSYFTYSVPFSVP